MFQSLKVYVNLRWHVYAQLRKDKEQYKEKASLLNKEYYGAQNPRVSRWGNQLWSVWHKSPAL